VAERTKATVLKTVLVSQFSAMPHAPVAVRARIDALEAARRRSRPSTDETLVGFDDTDGVPHGPREGGGLDVVAYIPGALLAIGAIVLVALAAYSIYWLIFRLGKGPQD
jgi:hypothetical protein